MNDLFHEKVPDFFIVYSKNIWNHEKSILAPISNPYQKIYSLDEVPLKLINFEEGNEHFVSPPVAAIEKALQIRWCV